MWKLEVPGKFFTVEFSMRYDVTIKMKFFYACSTNLKASGPVRVPF